VLNGMISGLESVHPSISAPEAHESLEDEFSMTKKRVLVVDDVTQVQSAVAALLRDSFDFEVVGTASDGRTALDAISALDPDLVVMDISMPGMTGLEVAKELNERTTRTKIVFLTVHEDADIRVACLSAGALGYVLKELMDSDLVPAMNEAIAGRIFVSNLSPEKQTP
jgi:two-component system response regulator NreC